MDPFCKDGQACWTVRASSTQMHPAFDTNDSVLYNLRRVLYSKEVFFAQIGSFHKK